MPRPSDLREAPTEASPLVQSADAAAAADHVRGTVGSSFLALWTTMVGAGILALPCSVALTGPVTGVLSMCALAGVSGLSIYALIRCCNVAGLDGSYETLSRELLGPAGLWLVRGLTIVLLFGATVMYIVIFSDLVVPFLGDAFAQPRAVAAAGMAALALPLCIPDTLYALRYASQLAMLSLAYIVVAVSMRAFQGGSWPSPHLPATPAEFVHDLALALPMQALSFSCQINAGRTYSELKNKARMGLVTGLVMCSGLLLYVYFSFVGLLAFAGDPPDDVLKGFSASDDVINVARVSLGLVLLIKVPLTGQPLLLVLEAVVVPLAGGARHQFKVRVALTVVLLSLAAAVAVAAQNLHSVLELLGSSIGNIMAFVIPGCFLWAVHDGWRSQAIAGFLMVFGVVCSVVSTSSALGS